jgi:CRISPR-associated endonuclease Csn1
MAKELSILTSKYSGSHALSNKTILKVYDLMLNEPLNSQEAFKRSNIKKEYKLNDKFNSLKDMKYIPVLEEEINNLFISPVVKRTLIQTLKVLRAIQIEFKDYEIDSIIIELAREKNSEDERKYITFIQEQNKKTNDKIAKLLGVNSINDIEGKLLAKISLLLEQDGKCIYCGRNIELDDLIEYSDKYEIDHIIPESISYNTKRDNLVLVHSSENNAKGNKTAYQYIISDKSKIKFADFLALIDDVYNKAMKADPTKIKYFQQKIINLTTSIDLENDENARLKFVNRNLVDTRYATTEIYAYLDDLRHLLKDNPLGKVKLKVLNGAHTDFIKGVIFHLPKKNRDDFRHHGIDAITIAYSDIIDQELFKSRREYGAKDATKILSDKYLELRAREKILDYPYHFSKKSNTNFNRQLTNDTLYSFKNINGEFKQMGKVNLTATDPGTMKILASMFDDNAKEHKISLLELYDSRTFEHLKKIYRSYPIGYTYKVSFKNKKNETVEKEEKIKNPFLYFKTHENQKITLQKNIKNPEKNPEIKTLRYYGDNMGKLLDVSHKYDVDTNKTKVGFTSLKPIRLDLYRHKVTKKYKIFPVNISVIKTMNEKEIIIDEFKYLEMISDKKYGYNINLNEFEKVLELFPRGTTIRITSQDLKYNKDIFEVVGSPNIGKLEINYIDHRGNDKNGDPKRIIVAVGTLSNIEKINTNILGTKNNFVEKEEFLIKDKKNLAYSEMEEYNKNV